MPTADGFDLVCLGSGPAGQKAAVQAAKAGFERPSSSASRRSAAPVSCRAPFPARHCGNRRCATGACGGAPPRWPSSCRETRRCPPCCTASSGDRRAGPLSARAARAKPGRADPRPRGHARCPSVGSAAAGRRARVCMHPESCIATGSRPRHVAPIKVDHEHILDSDSILSLPYIPRTLIVLGSGVIACEYASIFAALGCAVTLVDKAAEPLGFLDPALRAGFLHRLPRRWAAAIAPASRSAARVSTGFSQVDVTLNGEILRADMCLAAFGRVANLEGLGLERSGSHRRRAATCSRRTASERTCRDLRRRRCHRTAVPRGRRRRSWTSRRAGRIRGAVRRRRIRCRRASTRSRKSPASV